MFGTLTSFAPSAPSSLATLLAAPPSAALLVFVPLAAFIPEETNKF